MKYSFALLIPLALIYHQVCQAQIRTIKLSTAQLPSGISFPGHLVQAIRWTDKQGAHVVVASEITVVKPSSDTTGWGKPEVNQKEVSARHFLLAENPSQPTWEIMDGQKACPLITTGAFIENSLQVSDLNKDEIGEIWLMYRTSCTSNVMPETQKLIMYQGKQRFMMQGRNKVRIYTGGYQGGEYLFDPSFKQGPASFRRQARRLWKQGLV